jgi:hypothetical protein
VSVDVAAEWKLPPALSSQAPTSRSRLSPSVDFSNVFLLHAGAVIMKDCDCDWGIDIAGITVESDGMGMSQRRVRQAIDIGVSEGKSGFVVWVVQNAWKGNRGKTGINRRKKTINGSISMTVPLFLLKDTHNLWT